MRARRDMTATPRVSMRAPHRTGVRVAEDHRLDAQGQTARAAEGRLVVRLRERRVQSDPIAEAAADARLKRATRPMPASPGAHEGDARAPADVGATRPLAFWTCLMLVTDGFSATS